MVTVYVNDGRMYSGTSRRFELSDFGTMASVHDMLRAEFGLSKDLPIELFIITQSADGRVFANGASSVSDLVNTECILCLGAEPLLLPHGYQPYPLATSSHYAEQSLGPSEQPLVPLNYAVQPQLEPLLEMYLKCMSHDQAQALLEFESWHPLQVKYYKKSKTLLSALQLSGRAEPKKSSRLGLLESVRTYAEFMNLAQELGWKTKNMNGAFIRHQLFAEAHAADPSFLERWENLKLGPGQNRQTMTAQAARDLLAQRYHPLGMAAPGGRPPKMVDTLTYNEKKQRVSTRKQQRKHSESEHSEDEGERATQGISILSAVAEASLGSPNPSVRRNKRPNSYREQEVPSSSSLSGIPSGGPSLPSPSHPVLLVKASGEHLNLCVALTHTLDPIEFLCSLGKDTLSIFLLERGFVPGTSVKHLASTLFLYWVRCSCPLARRHLASLGASLQGLPGGLAVPPSSSASSASLYQAMSDLQHFVQSANTTTTKNSG